MKFKKILSVVLSLIMIFGVTSIFASAANTVVDTAEITVDTDIAGVSALDYEEYITVLTSSLEFEDNFDDPGVYVEDIYGDEFEGYFVEGDAYVVTVFLSAKPGYELADYVDSYVNGQWVDSYVTFWIPEDDEVYYVTIEFTITVDEEFNANLIDEAEIYIDTDLAGYYASDYEYYIDILTYGLEFEDNYGDPGVYVYDEYGNDFTGMFESGKTYYFQIFLSPVEGYELDEYVDCYVNDEWVESNVNSWNPGGEYGDLEVVFVGFEVEVTAEGESMFSIFDYISNFFAEIYYKFLLFLLIIFM